MKMRSWCLALLLCSSFPSFSHSYPTPGHPEFFLPTRYYDPEVGRFTSSDSIVQSPNDPQTLNRYAYVRNNPTVYSDPTGHSFWKEVGLAFVNPLTIGLKVESYSFSSIWNENKQGLINAGIAFVTSGGNPISAASAFSSNRFMNTHVGKRATIETEDFLNRNGFGVKESKFLSHFLVETAVSMSVESGLASLNGGLTSTRSFNPNTDTDLLNGGGEYMGRSPKGINTKVQENGAEIRVDMFVAEAENGNQAVVAIAPFGNFKFADTAGIMHASASSPAIGPTRRFGGSGYLYRGSCQQFSNDTLLRAGFGSTTVNAFGAGWTSYLSNVAYGAYGGQLYPKLIGAFRTSQGN